MNALNSFLGDVAERAFRRREYRRSGMIFRRSFSSNDWVIVEFQPVRGSHAPLTFYVNVAIAISSYTEFLVRGRFSGLLPRASMGLWSRRFCSDPADTLNQAWTIDSDDERAVQDFTDQLEAQLDELDRIADRDALLQLSRERARMVDKSQSGIVVPTEAAEALLLLDADDERARRASEALRDAWPDSPVYAWIASRS